MVADTADCEIRLHWHMYGRDVRKLKIFTRTEDGGPLMKVFSQNGDQGSFWGRVEKNVNVELGVPFQV